MKLVYISLCGFRGYSKHFRIDFASAFTIIDGRNGVGKSSIFDAVEFILLGTLEKYGDASSDGETAEDYIWWRGEGAAPIDRFVEVGFDVDGEVLSLRRTMIEGPDEEILERITSSIFSSKHAPESALRQLCNSSIIRDEQIAALSLDLKEGDRFKRLRDALGAADAEQWIDRASKIHGLAKRRLQASEQEVQEANVATNVARQRVEEARRLIPDSAMIEQARGRLRNLVGGDPVADPTTEFRNQLGNKSVQLAGLAEIEDAWPQIEAARQTLATLDLELERAVKAQEHAGAHLEDIRKQVEQGTPSTVVHGIADTYGKLIASGETVGLQDGHCPLCAVERTSEEFDVGLAKGREAVSRLDNEALARADLEKRFQSAVLELQRLSEEFHRIGTKRISSERQISEFNQKLVSLDLAVNISRQEISVIRKDRQAQYDQARHDLSILDSVRLSSNVEVLAGTLVNGDLRREAAEQKLALARRAETRVKALFDAARRAAGEVLNTRLDLVMPLMAEFYRRLRPHPVWEDIDYKLRGDVQRYLRLKIGEDLNPQFIYSSGQRRATGLAFLLSVNLSLSWNNWKTLMLDDPVQHIDDFRSVHLAEVLAKVVASGRQVICAAEDTALADLIARHLPVSDPTEGKRITLGVDQDGALSKLSESFVTPMPQQVFAIDMPEQAAG